MGTRNFVIATHPPAFFSFFFEAQRARMPYHGLQGLL